MKKPERNGRVVVQNLTYEDSGVAISGEPSSSGECDGIVSLQAPKEIKEDANPDPRYAAHCTIRQHYYPENGWGWVIVVTGVMVQILATGIHGAVGAWLLLDGTKRYRQTLLNVGWLGAMSTGVALLVSPVTIAFCRKKSTRVTAVLGGLVTALGCLFTSFASQFHQLFFSYGTVVGIGVGMTRDCSTLMVAQYFKRKRELVEIFIVSGSGLGIAVMSAFIKGAITKIGWRLGLQAVTGVVFLTFILGTFYRSASLYHPQRRAILHLKNQKRKIKDKNKATDKPPFFDFSTLKSKTVRILLVSTSISAFGINTPIFYLAHQAEEEGLGDTVVLLQAYLGLAWTLGCVAFGLLVVHRNVECRIARQYLTQAAVFVCGLCILALTAVQGNYHGYVMFAWIYGIFCGGYHYSLKMYTYERVRARNFARTWGFVQCSQAIPIAIGVPISGYINVGCGGKAGYYFSSTCVLVGSFTLFFIDLHRRNLSRHKHTRANGKKHVCSSDSCPQRRKLSFSQELKNEGSHVAAAGAAGTTAAALILGADIAPVQGIFFPLMLFIIFKMSKKKRKNEKSSRKLQCCYNYTHGISRPNVSGYLRSGSKAHIKKISLNFVLLHSFSFTKMLYLYCFIILGEGIDALGIDKPELTCISEEGIADMDLPDNLLEDFDYIGDCITSCNKVENYLMLSEFENNLIAEMPIIMDRCGRRWSLGRSKTNQSNCGQLSGVQSTTNEDVKPKWRFTNVPPNTNTRTITVIDEASI
ncbi:Monocarboxylate transporter 8 [Cyphomyrmex costatus]|uniref:Monocarboxylate transporter 8 n=1 Tax=Cyphomyrmex costatus TaxID=456900 RepID=A0A195D4V5_9HYME|nr:Monocarboxylate transporter 8 [Cyphomyrmex costatus]